MFGDIQFDYLRAIKYLCACVCVYVCVCVCEQECVWESVCVCVSTVLYVHELLNTICYAHPVLHGSQVGVEHGSFAFA